MSADKELPFVVAPGCTEGDVRSYGPSMGYYVFCVCSKGQDGFFSRDTQVQHDDEGTYLVCPHCKKYRIRLTLNTKEDG